MQPIKHIVRKDDSKFETPVLGGNFPLLYYIEAEHQIFTIYEMRYAEF